MKNRLRYLFVFIALLFINTVTAQVNPTVSIDGGNRAIADTDGMPGEAVLLRATAADADGVISDIEWLKDGFPEGWGEELFFSLDDGPNIIRVVVTDNDGLKAEDTVTITVRAPGGAPEDVPEVDIPPGDIPSFGIPPQVFIITDDLIIEDTDGLNTERVEVIANAFDLESLSSLYWTVDDGAPQERVSSIPNSYRASFSFVAAPGTYKITVYAEDSAGNVASAEVTIEVKGISDRAPKFTINNASDVADTNNVNGEFIDLEISRDLASQEGATATQFVLITSYPPSQSFTEEVSIAELASKLENIQRYAPAGEITLLSNYVSREPATSITLPAIRILDGESTIYVTLIQAGGLGSTVSKTFNVASPAERPKLSFGYVPSEVADTDEKPGEAVNIEVIIESEEVVYLVVYDQFGNKLFESEDETVLQVGNLSIPLELLADGHNEILVTARNKAGGTDTISTGDLKIEVRASEYEELVFDYRSSSSTASGATSDADFYLTAQSASDGETNGSSDKITIDQDEGFAVFVRIEPESDHIGKEADLFVLASFRDFSFSTYYYSLTDYGVWSSWNGELADLNQFESVTLGEKITRTILKLNAGAIRGPATLSFYVAYRVKGSSELYYSGWPITINLN